MQSKATPENSVNNGASPRGLNGHAPLHPLQHTTLPDSFEIARQSIARGNAGKDLAGALLEYPLVTYEVLAELHGFDFPKNSPWGMIVDVAGELFTATAEPPSQKEIQNALEKRVIQGGEDTRTALHAILELAEIAGGMIAGVTPSNARAFAFALASHIKATAKTKAKRFPSSSIAELLKRPDSEYLIDKFFVRGTVALLTAKQASFKSFLAIDIALSVALGKRWHGFDVKQGPVIYVAAEGIGGLKNRVAVFLSYHGLETPSPEQFQAIERPLFLADRAEYTAFIEEFHGMAPALIVLDTQARCALGLDENSVKEMGPFYDAADRLAKATGAVVFIIHHNNRGGEFRGSSAVPAAVQTHLSLERNGDAVTLKSEKQKDDDEYAPLVFEKIIEPVPGTGGTKHSLVFRRRDDRSGSEYSLSEAEQRVFDELLVFGQEGCTASRWEKACLEVSVASRTFYLAKKRLTDMKAVICPEIKKRGARFFAVPDWNSASLQSPQVTATGTERIDMSGCSDFKEVIGEDE